MHDLNEVREVIRTLDPTNVNPGAERGGNMNACYYADGIDRPACIAGNVFYAIFGSERRWLDIVDDYNHDYSVNALHAETEVLEDFTPDAVRYLQSAQMVADNGKSWGEAIDHAETHWSEVELYQ